MAASFMNPGDFNNQDSWRYDVTVLSEVCIEVALFERDKDLPVHGKIVSGLYKNAYDSLVHL